MKIMIVTLLLPFATQAAEPLVSCQVADFKSCTDCTKRVPVSCEDNSMGGSMDIAMKPAKIQWLVSNSKTGTEKLVTLDNKALSLKDLKGAKDLKALAVKQKVSLQKNEKVSLAGIQVASGTALFKAQTGNEIAMKLKPQEAQRAIASETGAPHVGGVGRAQKMKDQK